MGHEGTVPFLQRDEVGRGKSPLCPQGPQVRVVLQDGLTKPSKEGPPPERALPLLPPSLPGAA